MSGLLSSVATAVIDAKARARQGVSMQEAVSAKRVGSRFVLDRQ